MNWKKTKKTAEPEVPSRESIQQEYAQLAGEIGDLTYRTKIQEEEISKRHIRMYELNQLSLKRNELDAAEARAKSPSPEVAPKAA